MIHGARYRVNMVCRHIILLVVGVFIIYPLTQMIGAFSMTNEQIFPSISLISKAPTLNGYKKGLVGYRGMTLLHFMTNTYKFVISKVSLTIASAMLTTYGFAWFNSMGKRLSFAVLLPTLFLPQMVPNVPQYILFNQVGWLDSYPPIVTPSSLAGDTCFVYMLTQFLRGIPRGLGEVAEIDGYGTMRRLWYVIVLTLKSSTVPCTLFQLMQVLNDFMGPLIYVNTVAKYPVSISLRTPMDAGVEFEWNRVLATLLTAIVPSLVIFFAAQNSFVEEIAAGGMKG